MDSGTQFTRVNLSAVTEAVDRLSKQKPSNNPFLWHRPSEQALSQTDKDKTVVCHFEYDLWESFGLKGVLVPDELLKECQRRLHQANGDPPTDVEHLKLILGILDTIHRGRKASSLAHQVGPRTHRTYLEPIPPNLFRKDINSYFGERFWALIIGNDTYLESPLSGCVNDAMIIQDYLKEYLGVPLNHIRLLNNATRQCMTDSLYDLRDNKDIQFGDNILIHFSGHGTSYDTDEYLTNFITTAGSIEGICPIDRGPCVPDISERELNAILNELKKEKGGNITLFLDCCHSGGAVRSYGANQDTGAIRYTSPLYTRKNEAEHMLDLSAMLEAADTNPRRRPDTPLTACDFWMGDIDGFVQLAGCQDFQVAQEGVFSLVPNPKVKPSRRLSTQDCGELMESELGHERSTGTKSAIFATVKAAWKTRSNGGRPTESSQRRHGCFTWTLVNVLKSNIGRTGTYEDVIASIGRLSDTQEPVVVGQRKHSRLWFSDTKPME